MGLEAQCVARLNDETGDVKALLEARELILRGSIRTMIPIVEMGEVRVEGDDLLVAFGTSKLALSLGAATAAKWAKKIATPLPSLAAKLGIGHANPAFVIGAVEDSALIEALDQHIGEAATAKISLAVVTDAALLDAALRAHAALPAGSPIWIVNVKGPKAAFGDNAIRQHMRALDYHDSKSCAVSDSLSATRYARR